MNTPAMQLIIPYAHSAAEACQKQLPQLKLPRLHQLIGQLQITQTQHLGLGSLSMPHEWAHAQALGLPNVDGLVPWAAWHLRQSGQRPWAGCAFITPCHWHAQRGEVTLTPPEHLNLTPGEAEQLAHSLAPYFSEDGLALSIIEADLWLAQGEIFSILPTASLDRVLGQNVDPFMLDNRAGSNLRRLQNEMQMLLYTHPVNEQRTAKGQLPVNSFWVHGTGNSDFDPKQPSPDLTMPLALRQAALQGAWSTWGQAWEAIDATCMLQALDALKSGQPVILTLCSEKTAITLQKSAGGLVDKIKRIFKPLNISDLWKLL